MAGEGDLVWCGVGVGVGVVEDSELMRHLRGSSWEPKKYLLSTDWGCWGQKKGIIEERRPSSATGREGSRDCARCGQGRGQGGGSPARVSGWADPGLWGRKGRNWTWRLVAIGIGSRAVGSPLRQHSPLIGS